MGVHPFLTLALDGGEWSPYAMAIPVGTATLNRRLGVPQSQSVHSFIESK
jgi:hypothetical protein